jgi:hypothetical protein
MPPLIALLPTIAAAVGIAGTGITTGLEVSGALNGPGAPGTPATPAPTPPNAQQLAQQKALVSQQEPNVVGATSGLASQDYVSLISQILAGTVGQPGSRAAGAAATDQNFTPANSQPTNSVVNGQTPNLSDFLSSFSG